MPQHHVISWHYYYYFICPDQYIAQSTRCVTEHKECEISIKWDHPRTSVFLGCALVTEEELGKKISWPWHSFQLGPLAILLLFRVWFPSDPHAVVLCNDSKTTVTTHRKTVWTGWTLERTRNGKEEIRTEVSDKGKNPSQSQS